MWITRRYSNKCSRQNLTSFCRFQTYLLPKKLWWFKPHSWLQEVRPRDLKKTVNKEVVIWALWYFIPGELSPIYKFTAWEDDTHSILWKIPRYRSMILLLPRYKMPGVGDRICPSLVSSLALMPSVTTNTTDNYRLTGRRLKTHCW